MSADTSGFASFAARPHRTVEGSRSAPGRHSGGAYSARNRATGTQVPAAALVTLAALRCAHLGIQRRPPDSVERAAPSKCCATIPNALPFGTRAGQRPLI